LQFARKAAPHSIKKMIIPTIPAWIKKPNGLICFFVATSDIRAFERIAMQAAVSQIL